MLVGRCIPLIRSLVSIPAGFRRMPFATFTLYTAIGSAIWNSALIGAGYILRDNWEDVEPVLDVVQYVVIAAIVVAIGWFIWTRRRSARRPLTDTASARRPGQSNSASHDATTADTSLSRPLRSWPLPSTQ